MDDFSHIGYHRGDWFRWLGICILLLLIAAAGIILVVQLLFP